MKTLHIVAFTLTVVGALNWGLVAVFNFNLVKELLGTMPSIETLVYVLVAVSAVYVFVTHQGDCKVCKGKGR